MSTYPPLDQISPLLQKSDPVKHPKHYMLCGTEVIDIIKKTLTPEEYKGYVLGNILKYRLRAGKKGEADKIQEDIAKALQYEAMYNEILGD